MTNLPRVMISMEKDIEFAVNIMKEEPGNERVPKSKLLCRLIRKGIRYDTILSDEVEEMMEASKDG